VLHYICYYECQGTRHAAKVHIRFACYVSENVTIRKVMFNAFSAEKLVCIKITLRKFHRALRFYFHQNVYTVRVPSDFGRTRRASLMEIVKVSRDTMNYSYRGDAKLRETFLWRGKSFLVYVYMCVCECMYVHARRMVYSCVDIVGVGKDEGVRRARSRNECGKA
jgi:hypothetical protein